MSPDDLLLRRNPPRTAPALTLWDEIVLMLARVHEICGSSRRTLALQVAARIGAPVFWIAPTWGADPLNTDGVAPICPPQALTFLAPKRPEDILWCMEETLRAGCVPLVVADLPEPPGLTPVRRLHLAAEAGAGHGRCRPLGLLLTPWDGGAPGVETRLRCDPDHGPGRTAWSITRLRARMAPQKAWTLEDDRLAPAPLQEIRPPG
ncbi:ImuA family protein [Salipiger sp.]|uniref:ImuA family protein n=1 Tax=Salipiger sp. TaxID=2078585 RepID=UPI003A98691F